MDARRIPLGLLLAAACTLASACSRGDEAAPVATPSAVLPSGPVLTGRSASVTWRFAVAPNAPPFAEDYTIFVHAVDDEGARVWTADHQPPAPTSHWKPGTVVEYTLPMAVPRRARAGYVRIEAGIYSPRSGDRLPLSGENGGRRAYRVGSIEVQASDDATTMFIEGWHDLEAPDGEQGVEWRWSSGPATIWLRNPKTDAVFVLDLDQPAKVWSEPQQVTIGAGTKVLDAFDLPQGRRESRRVRVSAADLGDSALLRVTIGVDKTFVPAKVPDLRSSDTRTLGVRVFEAYLDDAP